MSTQPSAHVIPPAPVLDPPAGRPRGIVSVRCECGHCGAHVIARLGHTLGGSCGNCGSYELRVLDTSLEGS
jgi:hypothetical protein